MTTTPQTAPHTDIRTVSFVSLGCPKNLVDSEKMLGLLAEDGLMPVSLGDHEDPNFASADAVVINTCGFLEASKEESMRVIDEAVKAKEDGRVKRVVVAGCLVQRHRAAMLDWAPGIDAMVGVFDRDRIVHAVRGSRPEREQLDPEKSPKYWIAGNALQAAKIRGMQTTGLTVNGADGKGLGYFEQDDSRLRLTPRHFAYLRISEGCNQNCAFCTIPSIRGKMRSKTLDRIRMEARELVADGAFELNLIGQDTTSFGNDIGVPFDEANPLATGMPAMLNAVCDAFEDESADGWVRLMYAYPSYFTDRMLDAFAEVIDKRHVVPYLDIPLQHASDRILDAMRRNVRAEQQRDLLLKLRDRIPGMAIRTTFITGFPGETEDDHQELLAFIDEIGFDAMGVFKFSPEPGTAAARLHEDASNLVEPEVVDRRYDELMTLQQQIAFEQNEFLASQFDDEDAEGSGVRFDVLVDRETGTSGTATPGVDGASHLYEGRSYFQAPQVDGVTYVHAQRALVPGERVRCVVVASDGYDLIARPVDELTRSVPLRVVT